MNAKNRIFLLILTVSTLFSARLYSHCEIPCGIYDDEMRYNMLNEDIKTIEKSMTYIKDLSSHKNKDYNQIVRWINNKEEHAIKFMEVVSQYFLTQRIKPVDAADKKNHEKYMEHLRLFHEMLIYAMKCKQTVDFANTAKLSELVAESRKLYFAKE